MIWIKYLHKQYITFHKKTDRFAHRPNLPFKWTVMSSDKHELSRQQGVVTLPRPLVQSARLLPARLGTAEWRMEGQVELWVGWGRRRWAWISDRLRDVKIEGKIRGQKDRTWEKKGICCMRERQRGKKSDELFILLLILDAEMTHETTGPQVRKKQIESLGKHMVSIYPLHMSTVHRCR